MSGTESQEDDEEENWLDSNWADPETVGCPGQTNTKVSPFKSKMPVTLTKMEVVPPPGDAATSAQSTSLNRMKLNDNKAGMDGLDKEKINQIIHEVSKGSRFYENERKKEQQMNKRIEEQKVKLLQITEAQLKLGQMEADKLLEEFENGRDLSRTIVHIDMDAFYAAVEMRDNPLLKDKPMAVGGLSMLSTSNYHARKYGVRAAMPGFTGKKLCPELIIVPLNFDKYTDVSKQVREILAEYDPNYSPMSLDEAYLDLTEHLEKRFQLSDYERTVLCRKTDGCSKTLCNCDLNLKLKLIILQPGSQDKNSSLETTKDEKNNISSTTVCPLCGRPYPEYDIVTFGLSPDDAVHEMRSRIEQKTCLTASAGIAPNTMLAKVCSDKNKPNGQYRILPERDKVMDFITDLPTRKICGIGKVSETMLNALGVFTCRDLYNQRALLYHLYSQISFNYFMRICLGLGSTFVERDSERKSISTERTFNEISKPADLFSKCKELCEALSEDLKDEELKGKTVAIKIKTVEFEVKTRAQTLSDYTNDMDVLFAAAKELLRTEIQAVSPKPLRLRLMGVRMSSLLHQKLCKNKQNTLTGFIKRMSKKQQTHFLKSHDDHMIDSSETENTDFEEDREETEGKQDGDRESSEEGCSNEREVDFDLNIVKCPDLDKISGGCDDDKKTECYKNENFSDINNDIKLQKTSDLIQEIRKEIDMSRKTNSNKNLIAENDSDTVSTEMDLANSDSCDKQNSLINNVNGDIENYVCPVCQEDIECKDLGSFNHHIDVCLNKKIVKDCTKIAHEEDRNLKKSSSPKQKLKDAPKSKTKKKTIQFSPITSSLVSQFCKQKVENKGQEEKIEVKSSHTNFNENDNKEKDYIVINIDNDSDSKDLKIDEHSKYEMKNKLCKNSLSKDKQLRENAMEEKTAFNSATIDKPSALRKKDEDIGISTNYKETTDKTDVLDSLNSSKCLVCPVCFMEQKGNDLDLFNEHVDTCLSKDAITAMVRNENNNIGTSKPQKRLLESTSDKPSNKRQRKNSGLRTIDTFFKS